MIFKRTIRSETKSNGNEMKSRFFQLSAFMSSFEIDAYEMRRLKTNATKKWNVLWVLNFWAGKYMKDKFRLHEKHLSICGKLAKSFVENAVCVFGTVLPKVSMICYTTVSIRSNNI